MQRGLGHLGAVVLGDEPPAVHDRQPVDVRRVEQRLYELVDVGGRRLELSDRPDAARDGHGVDHLVDVHVRPPVPRADLPRLERDLRRHARIVAAWAAALAYSYWSASRTRRRAARRAGRIAATMPAMMDTITNVISA